MPTKGDIRKARKEARAKGLPLTGDLTLHSKDNFKITRSFKLSKKTKKRFASREEQHARYLDCGPKNWDDK